MTVYHRTAAAAAAKIEAEGFRDSTGAYLTRGEFTGAWVSDYPIDISESFGAIEATLAIEVPLAAIEKWEWVEEGRGFREWLVPADVLNRYPLRRLTDVKVEALGEEQWRSNHPDLA